MQKKASQNKDFYSVLIATVITSNHIAMQKPKALSELLNIPGKALGDLQRRLEDRSRVLNLVKAALPAKLAAEVVSAGIDQGKLNIGVSSAAWASRLRYLTADLRESVGEASQATILSVRIRVVPPIAPGDR
jgi:hypothetical protein